LLIGGVNDDDDDGALNSDSAGLNDGRDSFECTESSDVGGVSGMYNELCSCADDLLAFFLARFPSTVTLFNKKIFSIIKTL